jgi:hypothetical protein
MSRLIGHKYKKQKPSGKDSFWILFINERVRKLLLQKLLQQLLLLLQVSRFS